MIVTRIGSRAVVCAALVCSALACSDDALEPQPIDTPEPRPRLYMSVSSTASAFVNPTRLAMFDLSDPAFPRVETILEGYTTGWVGIARGTGSPSGRYIVAKRILNLEQPEPWTRELFLIDFDGDPLAPPTRLSLQLGSVSAAWSDDETMVAFTSNDAGQSLWSMPIDDGDPGPAARIPIEMPAFDTYLSDRRWDPEAERLYFLARQSGGSWRLFVAHHEDRKPVAIEELSPPNESGPTQLLWIGSEGRVITRNKGSCRIGSFDVENDVARTLDLPHLPEPCDIWFFADADGEPGWLAYVNYFESPFHLRWVELDWIAHWIELGAVTEVDAPLVADPVFAGERAYFYTEDRSLVYARRGESEAEVFARLPLGIGVPGLVFNRDRTRLSAYGNLGVLSFALREDGPGPALLLSPLAGGTPWTLHHDRFVQPLLTSPETGHVRVVDLGATPPTAVDLPAILPFNAIPSPLDSRVIVRDQTALFISDTATPDERVPIGEPVGAFVHETMLHAPGLGTYE